MRNIISGLIHKLVDEGEFTIRLGTPEANAFLDLVRLLLPKNKK